MMLEKLVLFEKYVLAMVGAVGLSICALVGFIYIAAMILNEIDTAQRRRRL